MTARTTASRILQLASALGAGLLFGSGLVISGMSDPRKVRGFLDITGAWDPSLAFVMLGAIGVGAIAFVAARRRHVAGRLALFDKALPVAVRTDVDAPLVAGSLAFGVGWGLSGFCPGPALLTPAARSGSGMVFLAALCVGIALHALLSRSKPAPQNSGDCLVGS